MGLVNRQLTGIYRARLPHHIGSASTVQHQRRPTTATPNPHQLFTAGHNS